MSIKEQQQEASGSGQGSSCIADVISVVTIYSVGGEHGERARLFSARGLVIFFLFNIAVPDKARFNFLFLSLFFSLSLPFTPCSLLLALRSANNRDRVVWNSCDEQISSLTTWEGGVEITSNTWKGFEGSWTTRLIPGIWYVRAFRGWKRGRTIRWLTLCLHGEVFR